MNSNDTLQVAADGPRVTARVVRTEDGETFHQYEVGGVVCGSLEALQAALDAA